MKEELNTSWVGTESPSKGMLVQEKPGENLDLKINPEFENLIPPLDEKELFMLKQSLWKEGCRDALVTWRGTILDGHHRYKYCKEKGLPFKVMERDFSTEKEARIWMIINQLGRRNVIDFVRGEMALELKKLLREVAEEHSSSNNRYMQSTEKEPINECQNFDTRRHKTMNEKNRDRVDSQIGNAARLSREQIRRIEFLKETATPEDLEELRSGEKSINEKYTKIKKEQRQETLKTTEFPSGKYRVIYADPPWDYGKGVQEENGAEEHYPVMSLDALCDMPIQQITDDNAVLFIWATCPMLIKALEVIEAWGFTYKSMFIWDKIKHNMGYYNSVRHELLLICTKGSCTPDEAKLFDSVQSIERKRHSEKPEEFRQIIETLYKYGNKIELFARKETEGWNVYGNEV